MSLCLCVCVCVLCLQVVNNLVKNVYAAPNQVANILGMQEVRNLVHSLSVTDGFHTKIRFIE